jgi:hypothetical protein
VIVVRYYSLSGTFRTLHKASFPDRVAALDAVRSYVEPAGFTNVREADDGPDAEPGEYRYTARTPGGRAGRVVATACVLDGSEYDDLAREHEAGSHGEVRPVWCPACAPGGAP